MNLETKGDSKKDSLYIDGPMQLGPDVKGKEISTEPFTQAKGFIFYPFVDLMHHDVAFVTGKSLADMLKFASENKNVKCFNTNGCMKNKWDPMTLYTAFQEWNKGTYMVAPDPPGPFSQRAPKIVHQIFIQEGSDIGYAAKPSHMRDIELMCDRIGWKYMLWTEKELAEHKYPTLLAQFYIINDFGGIYIDNCRTIMKDLDTSPMQFEFFTSFMNERMAGRLDEGLIGGMKNNKVTERLIKIINEKKNNFSFSRSMREMRNVDKEGLFIYPSYFFSFAPLNNDVIPSDIATAVYTYIIQTPIQEIKRITSDVGMGLVETKRIETKREEKKEMETKREEKREEKKEVEKKLSSFIRVKVVSQNSSEITFMSEDYSVHTMNLVVPSKSVANYEYTGYIVDKVEHNNEEIMTWLNLLKITKCKYLVTNTFMGREGSQFEIVSLTEKPFSLQQPSIFSYNNKYFYLWDITKFPYFSL